MPPLDPRADFQDDGGTPAWRARHAVTIDATPRTFRAWLRNLTAGQRLVIGFVAALAPYAVIPFGIVFLIVWDLIVGR